MKNFAKALANDGCEFQYRKKVKFDAEINYTNLKTGIFVAEIIKLMTDSKYRGKMNSFE